MKSVEDEAHGLSTSSLECVVCTNSSVYISIETAFKSFQADDVLLLLSKLIILCLAHNVILSSSSVHWMWQRMMQRNACAAVT